MQAILNQVIELCLIAMPVLFVLDIAAKVADGRRIKPETDAAEIKETKPETDTESDEEFIARIRSRATVDLGVNLNLPSYEELFAEVKAVPTDEAIALQPALQPVLGDVWADDEVEEVADGGELVALMAMSIRQLKALASQRQVVGYSRMAKAQLLAALGS